MSGALKKSSPTSSETSRNATSSPASESGATPFATPDGQTLLPFGQGAVHVHRSVRAGKGKDSVISGISGPLGFGSSKSVDLTQSLGSRLQATLRSRGSTLFRLTWKERTTPSGRRIYALRALGHRTSGKDFTSWPTPAAVQVPETPEYWERTRKGKASKGMNLHTAARSASWHTPRANDAEKRGENIADDKRNGLVTQANMASWATPMVRDHKGAPTELRLRKEGKSLDVQADLASWNTPQATDTHGGQEKRALNRKGNHHGRRNNDLALTVSGAQSNGSPAETAKRGQLNPAHSRWLMGLPSEWCDCAVTAMRSLPRSRKRSSKPTAK